MQPRAGMQDHRRPGTDLRCTWPHRFTTSLPDPLKHPEHGRWQPTALGNTVSK